MLSISAGGRSISRRSHNTSTSSTAASRNESRIRRRNIRFITRITNRTSRPIFQNNRTLTCLVCFRTTCHRSRKSRTSRIPGVAIGSPYWVAGDGRCWRNNRRNSSGFARNAGGRQGREKRIRRRIGCNVTCVSTLRSKGHGGGTLACQVLAASEGYLPRNAGGHGGAAGGICPLTRKNVRRVNESGTEQGKGQGQALRIRW